MLFEWEAITGLELIIVDITPMPRSEPIVTKACLVIFPSSSERKV